MLHRIVLLSLLAGCASAPPLVIPQEQPNAAFAIPVAQPMTINDVHWQVMTAAQLKTLAVNLQKAQTDNVVLVLDQQNYNNLSLNLVEIERYIKEQKAVLDMLKSVIAARSKTSQH